MKLITTPGPKLKQTCNDVNEAQVVKEKGIVGSSLNVSYAKHMNTMT